ncbi:putative hydrolase or acyltransferase of alpha/beta superfamily [Acidovorax sp. CF316]|uniref:alpha/beta fold hydrolase n=1 Tax=Acidovorax sp. CF316 TaxID=1144317 RepID=UPI00026BC6EB|nr:alpha/beta hydrolase [Acidovorax sp. CF316]EJE53131.1 putative hydrolase or acyltransferase of alpha/beta superfamily [Acidovorax sp. CF316]
MIAYDRPGFGGSPVRSSASSSIADWLAVLDHLGVAEPVVLVACSQGGRIALEAALAHPDRVRGLFLVAPTLSGAPTPQHAQEIAQLLREQQRVEEAQEMPLLNAIKAHLWLDGPLSPAQRVGGGARALFLEMNAIALSSSNQRGAETDDLPVHGRLREIQAPAWVAWGDLDFPHIQERSQMAAQQLPNGDGAVLQGTAHLPSLERPECINRLLRAFLGGL